MAKAKNSASKSKKADRAIREKNKQQANNPRPAPAALLFSLSARRGVPSLFSDCLAWLAAV